MRIFNTIYEWPEIVILPVFAVGVTLAYLIMRAFHLRPWISVLIPVWVLTLLLDVLAVRVLIHSMGETGSGCGTATGFAFYRMHFTSRLLLLPVVATAVAAHGSRPDLRRPARVLAALPWTVGAALIVAPVLIKMMC